MYSGANALSIYFGARQRVPARRGRLLLFSFSLPFYVLPRVGTLRLFGTRPPRSGPCGCSPAGRESHCWSKVVVRSSLVMLAALFESFSPLRGPFYHSPTTSVPVPDFAPFLPGRRWHRAVPRRVRAPSANAPRGMCQLSHHSLPIHAANVLRRPARVPAGVLMCPPPPGSPCTVHFRGKVERPDWFPTASDACGPA
jgi:hypothetical protein